MEEMLSLAKDRTRLCLTMVCKTSYTGKRSLERKAAGSAYGNSIYNKENQTRWVISTPKKDKKTDVKIR